MSYKIQCRVETLDSERTLTIRGVDGYRLEKEGCSYNVYWKVDGKGNLKCSDDSLSISCEKNFAILLSAKANNLKVELIVDDELKQVISVKLI